MVDLQRIVWWLAFCRLRPYLFVQLLFKVQSVQSARTSIVDLFGAERLFAGSITVSDCIECLWGGPAAQAS